MAYEAKPMDGNPSSQEADVYDVILNVSSHGIHNPSSLHAFKSQKIYLIPTKCYFCSQTIYPFTDAARCIHCCSFAHRSCCNSKNSNLICQGWASAKDSDLNSNLTSSGDLLASTSIPPSLPVPPLPRLATLLHIPEHFNSSLPPPGSPQCIWKHCLQELSKDYYLTRMSSVTNTSRSIEKIVNRLLSDNSTFPGRVFKELRELYMYVKFCSDSDYLLHAREVLDNIACAVVSILPVEIGDDMDSLKTVVTVVDWRVLRQADGSMYDKVFGAAQRMGKRMDNALLAGLYQRQEQEQQALEDEHKRRESMMARNREVIEAKALPPSPIQVVNMPHYEEIHNKLGKIPGEFAVMDKLERLVEALKLIATSAPEKTHGESHQDNFADSVDNNTLTLEETMQNYDIDADTLMQTFCQILSYETLKYEFYWHAESIFVDHMCREYNWLLGAEGYALVTLQQALRALCPITPGANAKGEDVLQYKKKCDMSVYTCSNSSRDDNRDDDIKSRYSSRDDDDRSLDALAVSVHNNEALISSSSKLKGIAMSKKEPVPVMGSE